MQTLKNLTLVVFFILLGIILGTGLFYYQKHSYASVSGTPATSTASKSGVKKEASMGGQAYHAADNSFSFTLPSGILTLEDTKNDLYGRYSALVVYLLNKKNDSTFQKESLSLYALNKTDLGTGFTQAKSLLKKELTQGLKPIHTPLLKTDTPTTWLHTAYSGPSGSTIDLYEQAGDSVYVFALEQNESPSLSPSDEANILNSLSDSLGAKSLTSNSETSSSLLLKP